MTAWVAALAMTAVIVSAALVLLTTYLHSASLQLGAAAEKVMLTEEAELHLLLHQRTTDPLARTQQAQGLLGALNAARQHASSPTQRQLLEAAIASVQDYLKEAPVAGGGPSPAFERTYAALDQLTDTTIAESRAIQAEVRRWDRIGTVVGYLTGALVILTVALFAAWIFGAFRPLNQLTGAMDRFAQGERGARASRQRYAEFDSLAHRFNEMADALDQQRRMQLAYVGGIAHDLRNPLSALKLSVSAIRPERPLPSEDRIRTTFSTLRRQLGRLERMLNDLVDRSRVEAGELDLALEAADLRELGSSVAELFQPGAPAHRLKVVNPDAPVIACCDPARVEQILNNLVSNAIKYSKGGEVIVDLWADRQWAYASVSDQGLGIAPEEQERIFEPYRRSPTVATTVPGVGLGLYVSRAIARAQGGNLEVRSEPGRGSTFTLRLPRPSAVPDQAPTTAAARPRWAPA